MSITEMLIEFVSGRNVDPFSAPRDNLKATPAGLMDRMRSASYSGHAGRSGPRIVSPQASAGTGRFRIGNQGGGFGAEHTHSNLG